MSYAHGVDLLRRGTPVVSALDAVAWHELPPLHKERVRRGYDFVAVCWVDPSLAETAWLDEGWRGARRIWTQNVRLDWRRALEAPKALGIRRRQLRAVLLMTTVLRCIDLIGLRRGFREHRKRVGQASLAPAR